MHTGRAVGVRAGFGRAALAQGLFAFTAWSVRLLLRQFMIYAPLRYCVQDLRRTDAYPTAGRYAWGVWIGLFLPGWVVLFLNSEDGRMKTLVFMAFALGWIYIFAVGV